MNKQILQREKLETDNEINLRPNLLKDFIGQEQIKANPKLEQSNSGVTAAFSDAVKNEPALQVQAAAQDISKKKGAVKPADNNAAAAPAAKTAAEIEKKKALHKAAFKKSN